MTYAQLINAVLRRLREDEISSASDTTYATIIGDFVNQAKREVEDAWNWTALRTQITVTTAAGTSAYSLTGAGNRCRVLYEPETGRPGVYNTTSKYCLSEVSPQFVRRMLGTSTVSQQDPTYYAFEGVDSNGDQKVLFYATPGSTASIEFNLIVPQADMATGSGDLSVPEYPVIIGAWALAISERGEDGGVSYSEADMLYRRALSDAIAQDAGRTNRETVWMVE